MRKKQTNGRGLSRRAVLKGVGSVGLAAASGVPLVNIARAQSNTVKVGYVTMLSGQRGNFGQADPFIIDLFRGYLKNGLQVGGKTYQVEIVVRDDQSDANKVIEIGNDLIRREQCDLILTQDSIIAGIPIGNLADAQGVPMISTQAPWQAWMFPRGSNPGQGFPYTFHFFWGADDVLSIYLAMWDSVKTNKTVGTLFGDEPAGRVLGDPERGLPGLLVKDGYKEVPTGFFQLNSTDFTNQVATFKDGNAEILSGFCWPDNWATIWRQSAQAGYKPEVCSLAGTFLFPSAIEVLGNGQGMSTEVWWTPAFPFKSHISGETGRQIVDAYQAKTGKQWQQTIGYTHALFDVAMAALVASGDPTNHDAVRDAIAGLNIETLAGPVNFKDSHIKNVATTYLAGGQWLKAKSGPYPYELAIVNNALAPIIPVEAELKLLSELA